MEEPETLPQTTPYSPTSTATDAEPAEVPRQIGRFRVEKVLGQGGFGQVLLALDEQLNRPVAIKVPHRRRLSSPAETEAYLSEARILATLDHPGIVPVYDVGSTEDGLCFIVSKWIEGTNLAEKIRQTRIPLTEAVELVALVADALHHAHHRGLIHRDVKPANILLDRVGKPHVTDFGLALKEEEVGKGSRFAGTPAYMSPEQARGEGHRVDGRSDIFSLGVVFYELLTARRPFRGETQTEVLEQVIGVEARPPRQIDDTIPRELERICLKALAKRASERYTTALDLADDLRHFLKHAGAAAEPAGSAAVPAAPATRVLDAPSTELATPASAQQLIKIVPKGLRSFDAADADFFLDLLPGPRDRNGLPESIRFWKSRVEATDADKTFSVGLIYGPSGCGKSSLVKAGLLPRLAERAIIVYVEATAEETESQLLKALRHRCPDLRAELGLSQALTNLRRGQGLPPGKKLLIVLDQFEQWLHERDWEQKGELVQALRQCDGQRVQCIILVRDDFWMGATRFMDELEVKLVHGENSLAVDLFDLRHARRILTAFGRALGTLPEGVLNREQEQFLDQAVQGLAQSGRVISVRLALFAEMVKGKPWSPATLKEIGGMEGVGVAFLEETFSGPAARPGHRVHQRAAKAVLRALLPKRGTQIKGHMLSRRELLAVSGYASRPRTFEELLRILDSELRLLTPTDVHELPVEGRKTPESETRDKQYQLTHDYLVPSIQEWLTHRLGTLEQARKWLRSPDRIRDAGIIMILHGTIRGLIALTVVAMFGLNIFGGSLTIEEGGFLVFAVGLSIILFWAGWRTLQRNAIALWSGLLVALVYAITKAPSVVELVDTHFQSNPLAIVQPVTLLLALFYIQLVACIVALVALYAKEP